MDRKRGGAVGLLTVVGILLFPAAARAAIPSSERKVLVDLYFT